MKVQRIKRLIESLNESEMKQLNRLMEEPIVNYSKSFYKGELQVISDEIKKALESLSIDLYIKEDIESNTITLWIYKSEEDTKKKLFSQSLNASFDWEDSLEKEILASIEKEVETVFTSTKDSGIKIIIGQYARGIVIQVIMGVLK